MQVALKSINLSKNSLYLFGSTPFSRASARENIPVSETRDTSTKIRISATLPGTVAFYRVQAQVLYLRSCVVAIVLTFWVQYSDVDFFADVQDLVDAPFAYCIPVPPLCITALSFFAVKYCVRRQKGGTTNMPSTK